jgi:hypothetical protein
MGKSCKTNLVTKSKRFDRPTHSRLHTFLHIGYLPYAKLLSKFHCLFQILITFVILQHAYIFPEQRLTGPYHYENQGLV